MVKKARPRAGSLAFYPRKKAAKETASFSSFPTIGVKEGEHSKPLNFLVYKAGMTHVLGKDSHEKGVTFGQEVAAAATVLEAPPLKVFGVRVYTKAPKGFYGIVPLGAIFAKGIDKALLRKIPNFKRKLKRKKKEGKKAEDAGKAAEGKGAKAAEGKPEAEEKKEKPLEQKEKELDFSDLEKGRERLVSVRLLCHSQPSLTGIGKKKPAVLEIGLSGNLEQQLAFAKENLGKEIAVGDVFDEGQFVDVKAVTKGKGMQGPVKRFGVKVQRPKAKKRRVVGSIGPWNPSTVMWTVARAGQMGYHTRTEISKKIFKIGSEKEVDIVNPKGGFKNYGMVGNQFIILGGSVPGPSKRAISLRRPIRAAHLERHKIESLDFIAGGSMKPEAVLEEEVKVEHVVEKKDEKKEKKSVQDEIAAASAGEQKREKPKEK